MIKKKLLVKKIKKNTDNLFLMQKYCRVREIFFDQNKFISPQIKIKKNLIDRVVFFLLNFFIITSIMIVLAYYLPGWLDKFLPHYSHEVVQANHINLEQLIWSPNLTAREQKRVKPDYDLDLPLGKWLMIPSASIEAQIKTNTKIENRKEVNQILDQGIYAYPDYAEIGWIGKTVILAGHHFNMTVDTKRIKKTFQNLNHVTVGDRVFISDDYKKWTYTIYKVEKSTTISEKEADLIMYTCVFWWDSDLRLFAYGKIEE